MGEASGGPDRPWGIRYEIPDFLGAMSVEVSIKGGKVCNQGSNQLGIHRAEIQRKVTLGCKRNRILIASCVQLPCYADRLVCVFLV